MEAPTASRDMACHNCYGKLSITPTWHALDVAADMIKHVQQIRYNYEPELWCPNCRRLPVIPVTLACGHTLCTKCIQRSSKCVCGAKRPATLHPNISIQYLLDKIQRADPKLAIAASGVQSATKAPALSTASSSGGLKMMTSRACLTLGQTRRTPYSHVGRAPFGTQASEPSKMVSLTETRFKLAQELLAAERYFDAAPQLAYVAAAAGENAGYATFLLKQVITLLCVEYDSHMVTRNLYKSLRRTTMLVNIETSDLECIICYELYNLPITTPCGHTFCRDCLRRTMQYRRYCPACSRFLGTFNLYQTSETRFASAALNVMAIVNQPDFAAAGSILLVTCTVAFPTISCPLLFFIPRYWELIKQVLESGTRRFGMVTSDTSSRNSYATYGTLLEVRDCVRFEDGRSIVSTIGVSRFKIIGRDIMSDGSHMAHIEELRDEVPTVSERILKVLVEDIARKARPWLATLDKEMVSDIESSFGKMPTLQPEGRWWESPNGPEWLWWLIAIMPLRPHIQLMMLSTPSLYKRMLAVYLMFDLIKEEPTYDTTYELDNELYYIVDDNH